MQRTDLRVPRSTVQGPVGALSSDTAREGGCVGEASPESSPARRIDPQGVASGEPPGADNLASVIDVAPNVIDMVRPAIIRPV